MQNLAYYNGRITPIDEMMIPANDRGFYFGDGVYEAAMAYGRRIFALGDHLERMENSARKLRIALPQSAAKIGALLEELSAQVDSPNQFLYWQITRGAGPRNHLFPEGAAANLYAYVKPWGQV
jgi:D-alanine transaminase